MRAHIYKYMLEDIVYILLLRVIRASSSKRPKPVHDPEKMRPHTGLATTLLFVCIPHHDTSSAQTYLSLSLSLAIFLSERRKREERDREGRVCLLVFLHTFHPRILPLRYVSPTTPALFAQLVHPPCRYFDCLMPACGSSLAVFIYTFFFLLFSLLSLSRSFSTSLEILLAGARALSYTIASTG